MEESIACMQAYSNWSSEEVKILTPLSTNTIGLPVTSLHQQDVCGHIALSCKQEGTRLMKHQEQLKGISYFKKVPPIICPKIRQNAARRRHQSKSLAASRSGRLARAWVRRGVESD